MVEMKCHACRKKIEDNEEIVFFDANFHCTDCVIQKKCKRSMAVLVPTPIYDRFEILDL